MCFEGRTVYDLEVREENDGTVMVNLESNYGKEYNTVLRKQPCIPDEGQKALTVDKEPDLPEDNDDIEAYTRAVLYGANEEKQLVYHGSKMAPLDREYFEEDPEDIESSDGPAVGL